jgi:hypothetical protein
MDLFEVTVDPRALGETLLLLFKNYETATSYKHCWTHFRSTKLYKNSVLKINSPTTPVNGCAVWMVGRDRWDTEIVGLNPGQGMLRASAPSSVVLPC